MNSKRGLMIVFEGCDRAGKTTQTQLLIDYLKSKSQKCKLIKFPDRTSISGQMIDSYLKGEKSLNDQAIHLLFSANRWEVIDQLKEDLISGTHLIIDRYAYSGVAFSAAKGLDVEWCKNCDKGLLKPDMVFFLDINNEVMKNRKDFGDEIYEKVEFQNLVRKQFEKIKEKDWKFIDASRNIEKIHEEIKQEIEKTFNMEHGLIEKNLWL